jgi:hypothetical protein
MITPRFFVVPKCPETPIFCSTGTSNRLQGACFQYLFMALQLLKSSWVSLPLFPGQWRSSVHFLSNLARTASRLLFSIVCLLSLTLFAAGQARADGFTITIVDNGDMPVTAPSLIITGSSSAASVIFDNCGTNGCTIVLAPNPLFTAISIPSNFYLNLPGNPVVADWYQFTLSGGDVIIGFSNTPPIDPLCSDHGCTAITGALVTVGQITWGDPVSDTIQFETASGTGTTPAPEPSSLLLLLGGLAGIAALFLRS